MTTIKRLARMSLGELASEKIMILQIRNSPKLEDKTTLDFYLALVDMEIDVRVAEIGDEYRLAGRK